MKARALTLMVALAVAASALAIGAGPTSAAVVGFQSPSKNIGCAMVSLHGAWSARCDIRLRSWPAPKRPKSCRLDYGNGVQLASHGRARYACAGDTVLGQGPVLAYGKSITRGPIRCTSTMISITCVNTRHHHGFVLSRESVRLY